jgi:hypothetical protein
MVQGDDHPIADGGRARRLLDRFRVKLPAGARRELWMRLTSEEPIDVVVTANGTELGVVPLEGDGAFFESAVHLPPELPAGDTQIVVQSRPRAAGTDPRFGSFHYWVFAGD